MGTWHTNQYWYSYISPILFIIKNHIYIWFYVIFKKIIILPSRKADIFESVLMFSILIFIIFYKKLFSPFYTFFYQIKIINVILELKDLLLCNFEISYISSYFLIKNKSKYSYSTITFFCSTLMMFFLNKIKQFHI